MRSHRSSFHASRHPCPAAWHDVPVSSPASAAAASAPVIRARGLTKTYGDFAAVDAIDPEGDFDAVINVQGDMPFADPGFALACAELLQAEPSCDIATLVAAEADPSDRTNPDVVKAVLALPEGERQGRALYFTRSTLFGDAPVWRHVGVYGYRREALIRFCAAPPSPLETREKLEQLRAMEMGLQIWARVIDEAPLSVDNPADLEAARAAAAAQTG